MDDLDGTAALVTGASEGIGRATVDALAERGADVALVARSEDDLRRVADEVRDDHGADAAVLPADVGDRDAVTAAVDEAAERFDGLDAVVSNAGVGGGFGERVDEMAIEDYERMTATNVDGAFNVARAALPHLRDSAGYLVFVGSYAGEHPYPASPVYGATKAWLSSFAESLQAAEGDDGLAVTVVNPGGVRTDFEVDEGRTQADKYDPGEAIEPSEVAEAVLLAVTRPDASVVTQLDLYRRDQFGGA